jgi:hypothetical protein
MPHLTVVATQIEAAAAALPTTAAPKQLQAQKQQQHGVPVLQERRSLWGWRVAKDGFEPIPAAPSANRKRQHKQQVYLQCSPGEAIGDQQHTIPQLDGDGNISVCSSD